MKKLMSIGLSILCLGVLMAHAALSAELPAGTIITKANLERIKGDTFEGKTIASLLTAAVEWQIKNWGLQIKLRHSKPLPLDPRFIKATKKYAGTTKFDPKTRECTGYMAGLPFPDVSMDDPYAAEKLVWNCYYSQGGVGFGYNQRAPHAHVLIADKGLERVQKWFWLRYWMKDRLDRFARGLSPVEGDGSILTKTLLFAQYPYDIRGIGTLVIRYDNPKVEDQWAYIKSVRRTRRLSGGAWMDPVGATDVLQDDIACLNGRPSWYPKFRLLGKRWILAIAHSALDWDEKKVGTLDEFPGIDLRNWPHWNPSPKTRAWEPCEVWVVEGTPPPYHPYSKRVVYIETTVPLIYMADCYDKAGNYWKFIHYHWSPPQRTKPMDGGLLLIPGHGEYIDFKRRHASVHYILGGVTGGPSPTNPVQFNNPAIGAMDVTTAQLEEASK